MSCYRPLKLLQRVDTVTGVVGPISSFRSVEPLGSIDDFDDWHPDDPTIRKFLIPCGQCPGCRLDQAHEWSDRLLLESLYQGAARSWFVTLTYSDENLPGADLFVLDRESGKVQNSGVLRLDDVSSFMKRLRSRLPDQEIRFFAAGEYGETTRRPHYHLILFADLKDVRSLKPVDGERVLALPKGSFWSPLIEETWGLGLTSVSPANLYTMSYVAGYVTKKLRGYDEQAYQDLLQLVQSEQPDVVEQPREAARMSRRPGIGVPWIREHQEQCARGTVAVPTPDGARSISLPRIAEYHLPDKTVNQYKMKRTRQSLAARQQKRAILGGRRTLDEDLRLAARAKAADPRRKKRIQSL